MGNAKMDIAEKIGTFVAGLSYDKLPENVKEAAKTAVLHSVVTGLAGCKLEPSIAGREAAKASGTNGGATLLGDGAKVSVTDAAFANACTVHARNQEDTQAAYLHVGSVLIPALMAIAENEGKSGKAFLEAMVVGYEVAIPFAEGIAQHLAPKGFRPNSVCAVFSVAAAASKLLGLNAEQTANAIRMSASFAGGIVESFAYGTQDWIYQTALTACNGITATRLAAQNVLAAKSAFDGKSGFAKAFAGMDDTAIVDAPFEKLGKEYNITKNSYKKYPICMLSHVPFIMTLDLVEKNDLKCAMIKHIDYYMRPADYNYPGVNYTGPFSTPSQCNMSAAFNIAAAIKYRGIYKRHQYDYSDVKLFELIDKITPHPEEAMKAQQGRIVIELTDGRTIEETRAFDDSYFELSWEEDLKMMHVAAKEVGIADSQVDDIADAILALEGAKEIRALVDASSYI